MKIDSVFLDQSEPLLTRDGYPLSPPVLSMPLLLLIILPSNTCRRTVVCCISIWN